jgi:protein-disulfide isomerase
MPTLEIPVRADDHVAGEPGAPLELVMYGDFQCPYCTAAQGSLRRVRERLGERLRFVFRHFPIREVHPDAERAAQASEAAAAQGAFWPMHDALYAARGALGEDDVVRAAAGLGLDADRVRAELRDGTHAERVERDLRDAMSMGLAGTPSFFANGTQVEGAFDARSLIDALEA